MHVAVVGAGYVGLSCAVLLAQCHQVIVLDIELDKIERINQYKAPIIDSEMGYQTYLL
ncbi:hypothetical protein [Plesiomonas shigelloides]|uniref:hypothetical protein n=1 Tax=Plesiomonas shigelloides TaxID=703 RepID=UPI003CC70E8D